MDETRFRLRPADIEAALQPVLTARSAPDAAESPAC
jgi:hypothetical protein